VCSREYPLYAIAGVSAVLLRENKLLLVKRGGQPGEGFWALPGGAVEAGEGIIEAASRELYEETGLKGRPVGVSFVANIVVKKEARVWFHYVLLGVLFDPESISGELKPGGDALDAKWLELEEIVTRNDVAKSTRFLARLVQENKLRWVPIHEQQS